jgi:hypothetical protein
MMYDLDFEKDTIYDGYAHCFWILRLLSGIAGIVNPYLFNNSTGFSCAGSFYLQ